ncbi:MAG: helix-turn-helix domain-containing protein [Anaerovoracaceae bacterium]
MKTYTKNSNFENNINEYPYEIEEKLMQCIDAGNVDGAIEIMPAYLSEVLNYEFSNIDAAKMHLIELCALISRRAGNIMDTRQSFAQTSFNFISKLSDCASMKDLEEWLSSLINEYSRTNLTANYKGDSQIVWNAMTAIANDENLKISLTQLADILHINPSYLSTHFKKETGFTFREYITRERVWRAKDLLKRTDMRLVDISITCGFEEQSYFTKVFKKATGVSPKTYRLNSRE